MNTAPLTAFTKLLVLDLEASARFYEALGFTREGADGTFVHLRWPGAGDVFLVGAPTGVRIDGKRGWGVLLGFIMKGDTVDALAERATKLSAPVQGPETQPWHTRELVVTDPDGYRLNFIEPATRASIG
jgi:catechol 2,3-dioxygenase-like lactoylglutathione lyase family enzyme